MTKLILLYLLIINAISFLLMLADKRKAQQNLWRIPEKTLFTAALFGGSIGSILGMHLFRHKTRHWYFVLGMPAILLGQVVLVWFLLF